MSYRNKTKTKARKQRVKKIVQHSHPQSTAELHTKMDNVTDRVSKTLEDLVQKHNLLAKAIQECQENTQKLSIFAAQELGKSNAMQQVLARELGDSVNKLDLNVMAMVEILKEVFGQLSQIDSMFAAMDIRVNDKPIAEAVDVEAIKIAAERWFKECVTSAFHTVHARMREQEEKRQAEAKQAEEAQAVAEKIIKDEREKALVETELKNAEIADHTITGSIPGGPGAEVPEGAEVFGG